MAIFAGRQEAQSAAVPLVVLHTDLIRQSQQQIAGSPGAETGGKFLGFIIAPGSEPPKTPYGREVAPLWRRLAEDDKNCLLLVGSISPGPRARCTPTELLPDGEFQDGVFKYLESQEPALEHLGTWHSHHPNGLRCFSQGDVAHYQSVIADKNYGPDFFVAGLCVDRSGLERGAFEIFGRRGGLHRVLGRDHYGQTSRTPSLQRAVAEAERAVEKRLAGAVAPLEAALADYFTICDRHEDGESLSLVIKDRSGSSFQGVVTQVKGHERHVEVSLEVSDQGATLRYDGPLTGDGRSLIGRLQRVLRDVDDATRSASRRR